MTTSSANNSVFRGFFEKQKLTGPNFIDWYRQLRIVLSIEDKLNYLEKPLPPAPVAPEGQLVAPEITTAHTAQIKGSNEIVGLMLMTMEPEIQQNLENLHAYEMLQELKTLFAQQAEQELLHTTRDFHSCKREEGQSISSYVLKMKGYIDNLERLGMGKTVNELHAMLKLHEQTLPKNNASALHVIRAGKGKNKLAYAPKPKIPLPPKREDPAKDSICHECGETDGYAYPIFVWLLELIGTPTQVCAWSCPNFSAPASRPFRMSTLVFVDPESSTQADGAQSSQVPVPLPEDPYEAIRLAYLDGTDTESEPFEDPIDTETPELPLTMAPPTSLPESTPLILVPILRRTARMAVRVPPAMSSGLSASMAEVVAMSESAFRKRFRSSYKSSPPLSLPNLPSRKRYRGTSKLVEDSGEDDDEEDEEIKESIDSDNVSENAGDEGPTLEDEDPAAWDEGLAVKVEGPGMDDESYGLDDESHGMDVEGRGLDDKGHSVESDGLSLEEEEEEAVPGGQQQATPVVRTAVSTPLGLGYGALRPERVSAFRQPTLTTWTDPEDGMVYIDVPAYPPPAPPVQTPPLPEWTSGSLPISPSPSVVPSPISSPMIPLTVPSPIATPAAAETEGFLTELGAQVEMQGD
ncbi:hypothetical protein Tco_0566540 [Tanacetum coccineum]